MDSAGLDKVFKASFSSPIDLKYDVPESNRYLPDFLENPDSKLLLEDPEAYTAMFKNNIKLLKASVLSQQDKIFQSNSPGSLAMHIQQTQKNYEAVERESDLMSKECRQQYDTAEEKAAQALEQQTTEWNEANSELGEKRNEYCQRFHLAKGNPGPTCTSENFIDLGRAVGNDALAQLCHSAQNESNSGSADGVNAYEICTETNLTGELVTLCKEYNTCMETTKKLNPDTKTYDEYSCHPNKLQALVNRVIKAKGSLPTEAQKRFAETPTPAFCVSQDNSGMGTNKNVFETFTTELSKSLGSAATPR